MLNDSKTLGIIGACYPEIVKLYFDRINEVVTKSYGEKHTIKIVVRTVDYAVLNKLRAEGRWEEFMDICKESAKSLERAGADVILPIGYSTLFRVEDDIEQVINVPVIKITEEIIKELVVKKYKKILLFGTKYTMQDFLYKNIEQDFGVKILLPNDDEKEFIHNNIYNEITFGVITPEARNMYLDIINNLIEKENIDAVVVSNSELALLFGQDHVKVPLIESYKLNINKGIEMLES